MHPADAALQVCPQWVGSLTVEDNPASFDCEQTVPSLMDFCLFEGNVEFFEAQHKTHRNTGW